MKKISLLMVMLLILSGVTFSQERGGGERPSRGAQQGPRGDRPQMTPEQRAQRQNQQMVEELKLTKEQEQKVAAINKKYAEKQSSVDWYKMRDASDAEQVKMRESMIKVQAEKDKEIKAVLNADQVKLYDEMLKKRAENRRNGQGRMGGQAGPGR